MEFFNSLKFGYQVMLIGIIVFVIGVIIMLIENRTRKRSPKEIKNDYLVKNNVRTSENPTINNNNSLYTNPNVHNTEQKISAPIPNEQPNPNMQNNTNINPSNENNSDLMNMYINDRTQFISYEEMFGFACELYFKELVEKNKEFFEKS